MLHPETVEEYQNLKIRLAEEYWNNRVGYTEGKSDFINPFMKKVLKEKR